MKRDAVDFSVVEPHQVAVHDRLLNWAKWCRGSKGGNTSPMFRLYVAPARARSHDGITYGANLNVDKLDAARIAKAVAALPEKHRQAIQWSYVRPSSPKAKASELGVSLDGLRELVRDARQMLINRGA